MNSKKASRKSKKSVDVKDTKVHSAKRAKTGKSRSIAKSKAVEVEVTVEHERQSREAHKKGSRNTSSSKRHTSKNRQSVDSSQKENKRGSMQSAKDNRKSSSSKTRGGSKKTQFDNKKDDKGRSSKSRGHSKGQSRGQSKEQVSSHSKSKDRSSKRDEKKDSAVRSSRDTKSKSKGVKVGSSRDSHGRFNSSTKQDKQGQKSSKATDRQSSSHKTEKSADKKSNGKAQNKESSSQHRESKSGKRTNRGNSNNKSEERPMARRSKNSGKNDVAGSAQREKSHGGSKSSKRQSDQRESHVTKVTIIEIEDQGVNQTPDNQRSQERIKSDRKTDRNIEASKNFYENREQMLDIVEQVNHLVDEVADAQIANIRKSASNRPFLSSQNKADTQQSGFVGQNHQSPFNRVVHEPVEEVRTTDLPYSIGGSTSVNRHVLHGSEATREILGPEMIPDPIIGSKTPSISDSFYLG